MALTIEDGTGKADSNSYVTVAEAQAYAAARGVALPSDEAEVEALLVKAMDYLEAQRKLYTGERTWAAATGAHPAVQALQWPRTGALLDCKYAIAEDSIPAELKRAQMQAAMEVFAGRDLLPSSDGRIVKKEKVDVLETEYMTAQDMGGASGGVGVVAFPAVDALLEPLYGCGGGFFLKTVRV